MTATAKTITTCKDILDKLATGDEVYLQRVKGTPKYNPASFQWDEGEETKRQHVTSAQMRYLIANRLIEPYIMQFGHEYFRITEQGRAALDQEGGSNASK